LTSWTPVGVHGTGALPDRCDPGSRSGSLRDQGFGLLAIRDSHTARKGRGVERDDGAVVAFEIKTSGWTPGDEVRGLRKFRDALWEAFIAGVVLYTGERGYT